MKKDTENKIAQLQIFEQNMQNILIQKQTFQSQLIEVENALEELKNTKEQPFKIIGAIIVATKKEDLEKDLKTKKETLNLRIKSLEKQESQIKNQAEKLQAEVIKEMKDIKND